MEKGNLENNEWSKIGQMKFSSSHIIKKFFGFESLDLVEIGLWDKVNHKLIYVEDTIKPDWFNSDISGEILNHNINKVSKGGLIKRGFKSLFKNVVYTQIETFDINVTFNPEQFYSFIVTSSRVTLTNKEVENDLEYILRTDAPIELIEYLFSNSILKENHIITIKKKED